MTGSLSGSVLVLGGGIGGMQSALDLTENGFKVYLLEKGANIGGTMSQLDKTFPTNDCSMCIMSPKLVEVARNPNIELMTHADLLSLEGEPGSFTATIVRHSKRIDPGKCTGCGLCMQNCPLEVMSEYNEGETGRSAVYINYPQAVPSTYVIDREDPPCAIACPVHLEVREYVGLIAEGRYEESLAIIRKKLPFPSVCGRVCSHPCEEMCLRGREVDDPVAIASLKRFVADYEEASGKPIPVPVIREKREEKVAIIGAGPAGLTCANDLALMGYTVHVFEKLPVAGGMLAVGIPEYRLPKKVLNKEIDAIKALGITIETGVAFGKDKTLEGLKKEGYKAVFFAVGAHGNQTLKIPGEDLKGVFPGVDFLRDLNLQRLGGLSGHVVVIGGGNVAIDAARSALRAGAGSVEICYRRSLKEMPASSEEIEEALEEGITFRYLVSPVEIVGDGKVSGIKMIKMRLSEPDESGRRRPVAVKESEFILKADAIIPAIGQRIDQPLVASLGAALTPKSSPVVDKLTLQTSLEGVFAGGDLVTGPAMAIDAMAAGKRAAVSIDRYIKGEDLSRGRELDETFCPVEDVREGIEKEPRVSMPEMGVAKRIKGFDEVQLGYTEEMAVVEAKRCLSCRRCLGCGICADVCEADAIDYSLPPEVDRVKVGAVILSPGFDEYNPSAKGEYGYGRYPNVVTSIEFERMLSATGPYSSTVMRPTDGDIPQKIAFIQCVGSRDTDHPFCSSVCCMYATKEAVIAKEHLEGIETTIFYIDIRAFGKGYDAYYERAQSQFGVKYVRSMISKVVEDPVTRDLTLTYVDEEGNLRKETFQMVVLAVGLHPSEEGMKLSKKISVDLNEYGFCKTDPFTPVSTSRPGVFVCGGFQGPKDIPETVSQASSAVAYAAGLLSEARGTALRHEELPEEENIEGQETRVGVFVCHCGVNIGSVVDVPSVRDYAKTLAGVAHAEDNLFTCSQDTQDHIKKMIEEHHLNRVVVASCSPRTHQPLFQSTIRQAGLNKYLFEMANIRDQCSWVHMHMKPESTVKAKDLVRMAVASARELIPLHEKTLPIIKKGLVIGGGIAGMTAALKLSEQGHEVFLIEKEPELGGNLHHVHFTIEGEDVHALLERTIQQVTDNERIHVITNALVVDFSGAQGNFSTGIMVAPGMYYRKIEHGVTIVATGGEELKPAEYLYGQNDHVVTQQEFEQRLVAEPQFAQNQNSVVMIQCVGSRNEERPYCSRVCCSTAVKNALRLKDKNPDAQIIVLYRDIRTYGLLEPYYREARQRGIAFVRYDSDEKPEVTVKDGRLVVEFFNAVIKRKMTVAPDTLVLSSATIPRENEELALMLKVPRMADGFFLEAHMKLRPVDFATDGIYVCGLAHSPKNISESIAQAAAAAARAGTVLAKDSISVGGVVAVVDEDKCAACLTCVRACPYSVPVINERGKAEIDPIKCHGCGVCAGECPGKAIDLQYFRDVQIVAKCDSLYDKKEVAA